MLDELVEGVEVDVGEELAVEVAYRQALVRAGAEQGLVRRNLLQQFPAAAEMAICREKGTLII